jgi:hypothetical protein
MEGVWVLREMRLAGADAFVPGDSSRFTVEFAPDGGMGVVADCNRCGGTYTLDGEALVVPDLVCTLVLCPTPEGQQFATLLEGTSFGRGGGRPARDRVRRGQADAVPLNAGRRRLRRHGRRDGTRAAPSRATTGAETRASLRDVHRRGHRSLGLSVALRSDPPERAPRAKGDAGPRLGRPRSPRSTRRPGLTAASLHA